MSFKVHEEQTLCGQTHAHAHLSRGARPHVAHAQRPCYTVQFSRQLVSLWRCKTNCWRHFTMLTCRARKSYVASSSTVWNDCSDVFPRRASVSQRHTSRFTLHTSRFTLHTSRFTLPQQLLSEFSSFRDHMRITEVLSSSQLFELFQVAQSRCTV